MIDFFVNICLKIYFFQQLNCFGQNSKKMKLVVLFVFESKNKNFLLNPIETLESFFDSKNIYSKKKTTLAFTSVKPFL